jgi:ABC-type dipeptide/oligopeptide/nickel transport system permease subunit
MLYAGLNRKKYIHKVVRRILANKLTAVALFIVIVYVVVALLSSFGIIASNWSDQVGASYEAPSIRHWFGTDIFGRSVVRKVIKSAEVAISVGFVVGFIAVFIGVFLGAVAGYFGGIIDAFVVWLFSTFSSVPSVMLLISLAFIMGKGILSVYIALGMTNWVEVCQSVRSEVMRHKDREYVQAASAIGASHFRKLCIHIMPNVFHIVIIKFSLIFQIAIKSEVVLSYLGLGVQGAPSWGIMIDDAKIELGRGVWWQLVFATFFMFLIVLAFSIISDALKDALNPRLKGMNDGQ